MKKQIEIDQACVDRIKAVVPEGRWSLVESSIKDANAIVNEIENSGRVQTTQDWYGDYLQLITSKTLLNIMIAAGGNKSGITWAARVNGVV